MIDTCIEAARDCGYNQCYLETLEVMEAANHLYHKNGFKKLKKIWEQQATVDAMRTL